MWRPIPYCSAQNCSAQLSRMGRRRIARQAWRLRLKPPRGWYGTDLRVLSHSTQDEVERRLEVCDLKAEKSTFQIAAFSTQLSAQRTRQGSRQSARAVALSRGAARELRRQPFSADLGPGGVQAGSLPIARLRRLRLTR